MGWPFGRQRGGHVARHAAPARPAAVAASAVPTAVRAAVPAAGPLDRPSTSLPAPPRVAPDPPIAAAAVPATPVVQLGFRDGSTYDVSGSAQGLALRAIADMLSARRP